MYKLLVWQDRITVGNGVDTRCYMFTFDTKEGATVAAKFYSEHGCSTKWIRDSKE